jgi:hypothetical protein
MDVDRPRAGRCVRRGDAPRGTRLCNGSGRAGGTTARAGARARHYSRCARVRCQLGCLPLQVRAARCRQSLTTRSAALAGLLHRRGASGPTRREGKRGKPESRRYDHHRSSNSRPLGVDARHIHPLVERVRGLGQRVAVDSRCGLCRAHDARSPSRSNREALSCWTGCSYLQVPPSESGRAIPAIKYFG